MRTREQLQELIQSMTVDRIVNELAGQCLAMMDVVEAARAYRIAREDTPECYARICAALDRLDAASKGNAE